MWAIAASCCLHSGPDFTSVFAIDGFQAWQVFVERHPDGIITDWRLAGGSDGIELIRRVRARRQDLPYTYIVVVSGETEAGKVREAFEAGADDYVKKPFVPDDVEARLLVADRVIRLLRQRERYTQAVEATSSAFSTLLDLWHEVGQGSESPRR